ncbi:MAG: hypothetical protein AVDCRST_MAG93-4003, partial [uncultured Chloroflexia bacterium]
AARGVKAWRLGARDGPRRGHCGGLERRTLRGRGR